MKRAKNPLQLAAELQSVCSFLDQSGQAGLAEVVNQTIATLRAQGPVKTPPGGVMTTGEAARTLGVRSVNTVKRWVQERQLEGFRLGGRVLVSRRSVERMADKAVVQQQRQWEQRVDAALAPFDLDDAEPPDTAPSTWEGLKPWESNASGTKKAIESS